MLPLTFTATRVAAIIGERSDAVLRTATGERSDAVLRTATGERSHAVLQKNMGGGFHPFRRDVKWLGSRPAPIQPLLDRLEFSAGERNWGQKFRYGLFSISDHDIKVIADAMGARLPER